MSKRPNLNELEIKSPLTLQTKYAWFLVSGYRKDFLIIGQKFHNIIQNSMKNWVSTLF